MKVKFFLLDYFGPSDANFATEAIVVAQGLRNAGIEFYANIDYWLDPIEQQYLFKKAPDGFDADVHVYNDSFYFSTDFSRLKQVDYTKINVAIDRSDELIPHWQTPPFEDYKKFDLILIDHYHNFIKYPKGYNIKPWQIGFDQRVSDYAEKCNNPADRKNIVLDTFRLPHNLRLLAINKINEGIKDKYPTQRVITDSLEDNNIDHGEVDKTYWGITGKRHNPSYFYQLNAALLTYSFGGFYHLNPPDFSVKGKLNRRLYNIAAQVSNITGADAGKFYFVYQWDSFRLWECLVSNTCPIFLDFESWGFQLPVNPVNGIHYIGVNGFDFKSTAELIKSMSVDEISRIGQAGKDWAIKYYSPSAVAKRFIKEVQGTPKYQQLKT